MPKLGDTIRCSRCMSANVYCVQNVTNGGVNWEVTACQDCDWPNEDNRPANRLVPTIQAVEDTTEGLDEYPEVEA